nr:MAG TPA: hypothetical protein [Caudoviricetes sp.]
MRGRLVETLPRVIWRGLVGTQRVFRLTRTQGSLR